MNINVKTEVKKKLLSEGLCDYKSIHGTYTFQMIPGGAVNLYLNYDLIIGDVSFDYAFGILQNREGI